MFKRKKDENRAGLSSQGQKLVNIDLPLFYRKQKLTAREAAVIRFIPHSMEHKITMPALSRMVDMDTRAVQSIIYASKLKGVPICCSRNPKDSGYYIATTEAERATGLVNLKHQANRILDGIMSVSNASLDNWEKMTGYVEARKDVTSSK